MKLNTQMKALAIVGLTAAMTIASLGTAEARAGRWIGGFFVGAAAATLLGGYAYSRPYYAYEGCYRGPVRCRVVGGGCWVDRYGREVCRPGREQCYRPTVCD